jgi:hypothetical protein
VGDLPEGSYWLVGTNPTLDEDSTHVTICFGDDETVAACAPKVNPNGTDDDDSDTEIENDDDNVSAGCSCGGVVIWAVMVPTFLFTSSLRRRRTRQA